MTNFAIVETDNFCRDYPAEKFLPIPVAINREKLEQIARPLNELAGPIYDRYWKVVSLPYKLQPGFEP